MLKQTKALITVILFSLMLALPKVLIAAEETAAKEAAAQGETSEAETPKKQTEKEPIMHKAEGKAKFAILPAVNDGWVHKNILAAANEALQSAPKKNANYEMLNETAVKAALSKAKGELKDGKSYFDSFADKTGADIVLGGVCWYEKRKLNAKERKKRKTTRSVLKSYQYKIFYYGVKSETMIAEIEGACDWCSSAKFGKKMKADVEKALAANYPFTLETKPKGASIVRDGKTWGKTPVLWPLKEGGYTFSLEMEGCQSYPLKFEMPEDRPFHLEIALEKLPEPAPETTAAIAAAIDELEEEQLEEEKKEKALKEEKKQEEKAPVEKKAKPEKSAAQSADHPMSVQRKWAWRTLGLAIASAAGGAILTGAAMHADEKVGDTSYTPKTQKDYKDRRDALLYTAYAGYSLAGASLVTSLVLFFVEPEKEQTVTIHPVVSEETGGVQAVISF